MFFFCRKTELFLAQGNRLNQKTHVAGKNSESLHTFSIFCRYAFIFQILHEENKTVIAFSYNFNKKIILFKKAPLSYNILSY